MPVLMTKAYMCSEQLLASQEPWVVTWCLVCYHPFVAEGDLTAGADHMALKTHACPTGPSVGCTLASSCPYVLRGACCCQSLSLSQFCFFASGATRCFCSKSPRISCTQLACLLSLPPRILQLGLMFQRPEVQPGAPHHVATLGHDEVAAERLNAVD